MMEYTKDEQRALEAVRNLPRPAASAEARERIRAAFLEAKPVPRKARPRVLRWAAPLAAAAALLFVYLYGARPVDRWVVLETVEPGGIRGLSESADGVRPGTIRTGDASEAALRLGNSLMIRLLPGTEMTLPSPPGRWFGREVAIELAAGEVYGTTGGRAPGWPLTLRTDEAVGRVTGTTFAVFRTDEASCFCLWKGGLTVTPEGGEPLPLPVERRVYVYKDGRDPSLQPISDMERMKLSMMDDAGADLSSE